MKGLIANFGASVGTSEEALICLEQEGLASLQIIFNLFRQHVADEVFAKAAEKGRSYYSPRSFGQRLLTGRFNQQTAFAANDHRNYNANGEKFNVGETFSGIEYNEGVRLSEKIGSMLPDERMAQWAIRWILGSSQVTTVIPGASKVSRLKVIYTLRHCHPYRHKLLAICAGL
jgi:aryl-alcohol dehydrogenase-like predicted oxidoreductase